MKVKLFGLTIFEIQQDGAAVAAATCYSPKLTIAEPPPATPVTPTPRRPWAELHQPDDILPRTRRGTIDGEASCRLLGITDPKILWQQRFKPGTVGTALKCILGAQGRKPAPSTLDQFSPDLYTCPPQALPLVSGTRKLDLVACLAKFDIGDPSVLWNQKFPPKSAGGLIKMFLRASGFDPNSGNHDLPSVSHHHGEPPPRVPEKLQPANPVGQGIQHTAIKRDAQGNIDIQASLQALGISNPKMLWQTSVAPGSAEHALKKAIARALSRRETVPGITRQAIGLSA